MKYYIIFGPPGAGKGTQSFLLTERYQFRHISTGQLLRDEIAKGSEVGKIAKEVIDRGKFVEDSLVMDMIRHEICNAKDGTKGFIFDGFPRTISQAEAFDQMLKEMGCKELSGVLSLEVADSVIVERIQKRARIEEREDDSSIETILRRIKTYHTKTEPLINYYKEQGKYYPVRGERSVEDIFECICKIIDNI